MAPQKQVSFRIDETTEKDMERVRQQLQERNRKNGDYSVVSNKKLLTFLISKYDESQRPADAKLDTVLEKIEQLEKLLPANEKQEQREHHATEIELLKSIAQELSITTQNTESLSKRMSHLSETTNRAMISITQSLEAVFETHVAKMERTIRNHFAVTTAYLIHLLVKYCNITIAVVKNPDNQNFRTLKQDSVEDVQTSVKTYQNLFEKIHDLGNEQLHNLLRKFGLYNTSEK